MSASTAAIRKAEQELMDAERDAQLAQDNADNAIVDAQKLQLYSDEATPRVRCFWCSCILVAICVLASKYL